MLKNEIYSESYYSYTIKIFKSGQWYIGIVSYGGKERYQSTAKYSDWQKRYLLWHLRWWVRDMGNKTRKRGRVAS